MKGRAGMVLLASVLACGMASASEWVSIGKTADGKVELSADVSSIKISGDQRWAWIKAVPARHTEKGAGASASKWVESRVNRFRFDCADETSIQEAENIYYTDGSNSATPSFALDSMSTPVAPDTVLRAMMEFTCSWKPPVQVGDSPAQIGNSNSSGADNITPAHGVITLRMPKCGEDFYPSQARRLKQRGSAIVRVCIGVNNAIDRPVEVVSSSGFPLLDEAATKCVSAGHYAAGAVNGVPAATCKEFRVTY